jgi:two-component system, chemotaxis family, CheB/CheR fusion protein
MSPSKKNVLGSTKEKTVIPATDQFPIVGIGASAGGLEAFEQFFGHLSENSGMAFVVIQHLDPTQKGILPELLQRVTKMNVFQVKDRTTVKPNCLYVIPPNKSMSIFQGVLHLSDPKEERGMRLPINYFLTSLAEDQRENAIGVILSGMGSDGSEGVRAIKERNGIVLVQDPGSAKFDSMPRSAIDSVAVDIVATSAELSIKLISLLKHTAQVPINRDGDQVLQSALEKILTLLRNRTGNDFSLYKRNTIYRRIERRMHVYKIEKIQSYVKFLQENPKETDILFKELLIGVTNFFRDVALWEKLKDSILPALISKQSDGTVLRAWIPGCSTGEEAFSLAIVFKEVVEKLNPHGTISLQIFATDLDNDAINTARKGIFTSEIKSEVSPARLSRFFNVIDSGYRINSEIREMIVFAQHNIIMHPPFSKIHLLSCRNLLIYLDNELQRKLISLFYYSICPAGILVLGSAETLGSQASLFIPIDSKLKIYKRSGTLLSPELYDFPSSFSKTQPIPMEIMTSAKTPQNLQSMADQLLLQSFSPPGVLVNDNGDILYISGRTGKYLEPSVGKANMNIFAMLREGLRNEFPIAFRKALKTNEPIQLLHVRVETNEGSNFINVTFQRITKPQPLSGMIMIIFTEIPVLPNQPLSKLKGVKTCDTDQSRLEFELRMAHEQQQNMLEEMQTSQEELKSTNEELQSTNEELQSTNEELTTSKEEMQSMNEELQTVNAELQSKVDEFSRVNNDMKNLLNSTDIATLFLDKSLNIRRFTNEATKIFKLIKSDVGRPFTDLVTDLIYPELAADAMEVLRSLILIEKQIPSKDGRWFSIRVMPYRTFDDRIDGLVITFFNHTDIKQVEIKLHEMEQIHKMLMASSSDVIIRLSSELNIMEFNPIAEHYFGKTATEVLEKSFVSLFISERTRQSTEKELATILKNGCHTNYRMNVIIADGKTTDVDWSVQLILNNQQESNGMFLLTHYTIKP